VTARSVPHTTPLRLLLEGGPPAVAASAVLLVIAYLAGPSVFMTVCASVVMWAVARGPAERALALLLPAAFRVALAAGAFAFEPPVQILELAVRHVDPLALVAQQYIWWPRYLVSYPSIVAMDHWGMRFNDAYALYSAALLPLTALALVKAVRIGRRLDETRVLAVGIGLALLVAVLATQMNGRLIAAHLGMALVLLAQGRVFARRRLRFAEALMLAGGLVLGHMSSGTGLVAYAQVLAGSGALALAGIERRRVLALLSLLTAVLGPLLYGDLVKNLEFYGGGVAAIVNMLDHGLGLILRRDPRVLTAAIVVLMLLAVALWRSRGRILQMPASLWPAMIALPVTTIGGLYGYSALTMSVPAVLVLAGAGTVAMLERPRPARQE